MFIRKFSGHLNTNTVPFHPLSEGDGEAILPENLEDNMIRLFGGSREEVFVFFAMRTVNILSEAQTCGRETKFLVLLDDEDEAFVLLSAAKKGHHT
jgi:hypothetical protein